ncbi:T7SS effector LXG polymorphic toxin [Lentibacillus sp. L22]|uniref:T7SS effector LXG polymorphic toxin n=1 Tax=Lentibacillus TaxID=175304 RepID=UPI0022B0DB98|nr:T7SS effector LXG polymorphic toxin [Lentibacillus daqui]
MGHKVDISEVIDFSDDLKTMSEDIQSSLDDVQESIDQINAMSTFSGKTAKEAKGYFNDLHKTILEAFNGLFTDLENNLKKHLDTFESNVDSSKLAIIQSNYLNDTAEDVNDDYQDLLDEHESIYDTISSVADISSATSPSLLKSL